MNKLGEPSKLFVILGGQHSDDVHAVLSLPEVTDAEIVIAAWAYAVTFSAKGLNRTDYDAAVELLKKRHPNWQVLGRGFTKIGLNLAKADDDIPEAQ
jgi:hypothetical protein